MKKLIIASVVCASAMFASAAFYTNSIECARACVAKNSIDGFNYARIATNDIAEVDNIISAGGLFWFKTPAEFTNAKVLRDNWMKANRPGYWAFECAVATNGSQRANSYVFCNQVDGLVEGRVYRCLIGYKKQVIKLATAGVKAQLRKEGKSFVTKDGVNPVQVRLDAVTTALDAPRFAGLKEALAGVGIDLYADPAVGIWPDSKVADVKTKVLYGSIPFNDIVQRQLTVALGVTEYNNFVKLYNGEE